MPSKSFRPLSPHLQIYRLPLSALLSITHRMTGLALSAGLAVLVVWLWLAAFSPDGFAAAKNILASPLGRIALFGWSFAFFYHMCAGIRHLVWDTGVGFEKPVYKVTNWLVIISAVLLTAALWLFTVGGAV